MPKFPDKFEVAFSYAGEDRNVVAPIAEIVGQRLDKSKVFFDQWWPNDIKVVNADLKLQGVYKNAEMVVLGISKHYNSNLWTNTEYAVIRDRINGARQRDRDLEQKRIFFIRVGEGDVDGITATNIWDEARGEPAEKLANSIVMRLTAIHSDERPQPERPGLKRLGPQPAPGLLGREKLVEDLTSDVKKFGLVNIHGGPGIGKSSLLWLFWNKEEKKIPPFDGAWAFWLTFKNQGVPLALTTTSEFFSEAFKYFSGGSCDVPIDPYRQGEELARLIQARCSVLILDGIDAFQDEKGGVKKDEVALLTFLEELGRFDSGSKSHEGFVLISTRKPLNYHFFKSFPLYGMEPEEGALLLEKRLPRCSNSRQDLLQTARDNHGHPYALVLLANALNDQYSGQVSHRRQVTKLGIDLATDGIGAIPREYMKWYDEVWQKTARGKQLRTFMRIVSLFGRAVEYEEFEELISQECRMAEPLKGYSGQDQLCDYARELNEISLVFSSEIDKDSGWEGQPPWDTHALAREYFSNPNNLEEESEWVEAHKVLFRYFDRLIQIYENGSGNWIKLLYRAMHHGCLVGEYDEVARIYRRRIEQEGGGVQVTMTDYNGTYEEEMNALSHFFHTDRSIKGEVSSGKMRAWLYDRRAYCAAGIGRLRDAISLRQSAIDEYMQLKDKGGLAFDAKELAMLRIHAGDLRQARRDANKAIEYAGDENVEATVRRSAHARLGSVLHRMGDLQEAQSQFQEAEAIQDEKGSLPTILVGRSGIRYCALLLDMAGNLDELKALMKRVNQMKDTKGEHLEHEMIAAFYDLAIGRIKTEQMELGNDVFGLIDDAQRKIELSRNTEYICQPLLARAEYYRKRFSRDGDHDSISKGLSDSDQALKYAERFHLRLLIVDSCLMKGNLLLDKLHKDVFSLDDQNGKAMIFDQVAQISQRVNQVIEETDYRLRKPEADLLKCRLLHYQGNESVTWKLMMIAKQIDNMKYLRLQSEYERVERM